MPVCSSSTFNVTRQRNAICKRVSSPLYCSAAVFYCFEISNSSTYLESEHPPWSNTSCHSSHTHFTFFYLSYHFSALLLWPCKLIPSHLYLYALYALTIFVVHGSPPLPNTQFPNCPTILRTVLYLSTSHYTSSISILYSQPFRIASRDFHLKIENRKPCRCFLLIWARPLSWSKLVQTH